MSTFRSFDPKEIPQPKLHGLLLSSVAPRPIAFASTVDADGRPNLAPFSFFNVFSSNPPICIFSPALRGRDATTKHTLENVKVVPEVVINVVNHAIVQQCSLASAEFDLGVNEFEKAGLTGIGSERVRPLRVAESPVQLECKVNDVIALGDKGGAGNLVMCEVLLMHVNEQVLNEDGRIDQHRIDLVARLGNDHYCRASGNALFDVPKPGSRNVIGFDGLPLHVRTSGVLTGNDLAILANCEAIPVSMKSPSLPYSEPMRPAHVRAQQQIAQSQLAEAWHTLLN